MGETRPMGNSFITAARVAFQYLEEEFGLRISKVQENERRPSSDAYIEYSSTSCVVALSADRGAIVPPVVSRMADQGKYKHEGGLTLDRICEYRRAKPQDVARLSSRDFDEIKRAWQAVVEENDRREYRMMMAAKAGRTDITSQVRLTVYAGLLREYGEPFLRGEFSTWLALHEYNWHWLVAQEIVQDMRWGEELTFENIEKRFSNVREYLYALRKEYGRE